MTRLSVNINKIATLRNARGGHIPDVIKAAVDIVQFGANGITVHPRPDERHIRKSDVYELKKVIAVELNIEGYPSKEFLSMIADVRPAQATLVPDPPDVITSNAGWNIATQKSFLKDIIDQIKSYNVRTSVFIDPDERLMEHAKETGTDRIELYTEMFARDFYADKQKAVQPYVNAAGKANEFNLGINAGHDLNLDNLKYFKENVPGLLEVSIGHALISDALYWGFENTVQIYLRQLK